MAEPVPISLGYRSNPARNHQSGICTLTNCFAEETGEDSKSGSFTIYGTEGLEPFGAPLEGGTVRAMIVVGATLYVVCGRRIYAVTSSGVATQIGGIASDEPITIERNRRVPAQIGIVAGGLFYIIDTGSNSVTEINDPDLPSPISISVLDGFGILPIPGGSFMLTAIDDFSTIDALDEGTAEAYPDEILRSMVLERELILMGETSTEWHQNTGAADFPFTRVHALEQGWLAPDSISKVDTPSRKTVIGIATDHTVRMLNGYSTQVISTNDIELKIKEVHKAGNVNQFKSAAWAYEGRFFYALTCESWTKVYDSKTGFWHDRKSYGLSHWRITTVVPFANKLIAGDHANGQLYSMGADINTEAGEHLVHELITPPVHAFPYKIGVNALYIDAATGVGLNTSATHSNNPKLMVSWTKDGGDSWSAERERTLHPQAEYHRVQPIYRLGRAGQKGISFRLRLSAPVPSVTIAMSIDFDRLGV